MKIVDFIVLTYYILFRKAKQNQLEGSVFLASIIPILFIVISLMFWIIGFLFDNAISYIIIGFIILVLGFGINSILYRYYMLRKRELNKLCDKYDKYKFLFVILLIVYIVSSLFLFFYSMRFLPQ